MNPNQNTMPGSAPAMSGVPGVGGAMPSQPAQPVQPVKPIEPVVPEEPNVMDMAPAKPKKKSNGMLIGMILLALVAAGGVGFGVYAMMDGNTKVDNLNKQIKSLKDQNAELLEKLSEAEGNGGSSADDGEDETTPSTEIPQSVSIDDWGITVNMPASLKQLSYILDANGNELCVSGYIDNGSGTVPSFAGTPGETGTAYVCVHRGTGDHQDGATSYSVASADFQLGDYYYWVKGPQAVATTIESEIEWENDTIQAFLTALKNVNNYSIN